MSEAAARARRVWSLGSYEDIAPDLLPLAERLVDEAGPAPGDRILDVACGTGNVALAAARRGARVTGLDVVPGMLDKARRRAERAGVEVRWHEGDAAALPFADGTFDVTLSCLGHIFAAPPEAAGRELVRVTRPGGRVAFLSWTPESAVAAMGSAVREFLPPEAAPGEPPFRWGDPEVAARRLGDEAGGVRVVSGTLEIPVASAADYWQRAVTESGPFIGALSQVSDAHRDELRQQVVSAMGDYFDPGGKRMALDYRMFIVGGAPPPPPASGS